MKYIVEADEYVQMISLIAVREGTAIMITGNVETFQTADKAIDEAYHKGFEAGSHEATTLEYQQGLDDAWKAITKIANMPDGKREKVFGDRWISNILNKFSASEIINILDGYEPEQDEIKVSDIITDGKINYLVIDITDNSYVALQGTDFEPVYIGKDYIKSYHNLHDPKDMHKVAEEINKAVRNDTRL